MGRGEGAGLGAVPQVFVSYASKDATLVGDVLRAAEPAEDAGQMRIWRDKVRLVAGDDFTTEIKEAVDRSAVALVLLTPAFLESEFIREVELPYLLRRHAQKLIRLVPVVLTNCQWKTTPLTRTLHVYRQGAPLVGVDDGVDGTDLVEELQRAIRRWNQERNQLKHALTRMCETVTASFADDIGNPAQREAQLTAPVQTFLYHVGAALDLKVVARSQASGVGVDAVPDFGVSIDGLRVGHVELKQPGDGANVKKFKGHNKTQWKKLANLPNVVYTDGNEWTLYRDGEPVGSLVRLSGDVTTEGAAAFTDGDVRRLDELLKTFLGWAPAAPQSPTALAKAVAPLCRYLRDTVADVVAEPKSAVRVLAGEWRDYLFPDASDRQFADAYAQTLTYGLLIDRLSGTTHATRQAAGNNGLLGEVMKVLEQPRARAELDEPIGVLERLIDAVDPVALKRRGTGDVWLYFYEEFLAAYDPKLRNEYGVYYTPVEVVRCQVRLVDELLRTRLGKAYGLVDDKVVLLDPAAGTGTYLLTALEEGLQQFRPLGAGIVAERATAAARNYHAFEVLVGPYSVANLRFDQLVTSSGGTLPVDGPGIYLADTLENPELQEKGQLDLLHQRMIEERNRAREVKNDVRVVACIGNPPYDRHPAPDLDAAREDRPGGWVRWGASGTTKKPILDAFTGPALDAKAGGHLKNLYNLYVYFWRWAIWKVLDESDEPGVISFITASSFLRGPGFVGMRQKMRQAFDEIWVIDLEGDDLGARKTENVFAIRSPVVITVGVRHGGPQPDTPAKVHYTRVTGSRVEKLAHLDGVRSLDDCQWRTCFSGWQDLMLPHQAGGYFDYPALTTLFPWQHSGVQAKRTWPVGHDAATLKRRWKRLLSVARDRADYFVETRDRKVDKRVGRLLASGTLTPLAELLDDEPSPAVVDYAYRSFDRQKLLLDNRLADFVRASLWASDSPHQVFMTSLISGRLGSGPAATVSAAVPDLHHFRGSFGGKDTIPLFRDAAAQQPNVNDAALDVLSRQMGTGVSAADLFAYCYCLLSAPSYTFWFSDDLDVPGPRVPVTKDPDLWQRAVTLGQRLVWLHTFGERMTPQGETRGAVVPGQATNADAVPGDAAGYPSDYAYDPGKQELRVGAGLFTGVSPAVWNYSVSGLQVVKSWLDYRMKAGAGKASSPLDKIRPERWDSSLELLRLLRLLEATLELGPQLDGLLDDVIAGPLIGKTDLPDPTAAETKAPAGDDPDPDQGLLDE